MDDTTPSPRSGLSRLTLWPTSPQHFSPLTAPHNLHKFCARQSLCLGDSWAYIYAHIPLHILCSSFRFRKYRHFVQLTDTKTPDPINQPRCFSGSAITTKSSHAFAVRSKGWTPVATTTMTIQKNREKESERRGSSIMHSK